METIEILIYSTSRGKEPFSEWEDGLDTVVHATVANRLRRIRLGNFGDAKMIKGSRGIWELRLPYGPGYRIYFGKRGKAKIILLTGDSKRTQKRDILKAQQYWCDYKESE